MKQIVNEYEQTPELLKNYYKLVSQSRFVFIGIVLVLFIASFIINLINNSVELVPTILGFAAFIILIGALIYNINKTAQITYERIEEQTNGKKFKIKVIIKENDINLSTNIKENDSNFKIENIKKVKESKELFVLITKTKLGIILKKDSFTKGNLEDLKQLIKKYKGR